VQADEKAPQFALFSLRPAPFRPPNFTFKPSTQIVDQLFRKGFAGIPAQGIQDLVRIEPLIRVDPQPSLEPAMVALIEPDVDGILCPLII
jgi:hypothetical protein